jgi:hypothetical protein
MELAKGCPMLGMGAGVETGQVAVPPAAVEADSACDRTRPVPLNLPGY